MLPAFREFGGALLGFRRSRRRLLERLRSVRIARLELFGLGDVALQGLFDGLALLACVEIKFTVRSRHLTRRLLDGVTMPVPHPRHRREMT